MQADNAVHSPDLAPAALQAALRLARSASGARWTALAARMPGGAWRVEAAEGAPPPELTTALGAAAPDPAAPGAVPLPPMPGAAEQLWACPAPGAASEARLLCAALPTEAGPERRRALEDAALLVGQAGGAETAERYRSLFEQAYDGILLVDHTLAIRDANHSACRMLGYDAEALRGRSLASLISPESLAQRPVAFGYVKEHQVARFEREFCRPDGGRLEAEVCVKLIGPGLAQVVLRDTGEVRRILAALREREAVLKALFQAFPDAIFRVSPEGVILDAHLPAALDLQGPIVGQPYRTLAPPDLAQRLDRSLGQALRSGGLRHFEYTAVVDGRTRFYEFRIVRTTGGDAVGIVRDMTDRRQVEAQILKALSEERARLGQDFHDGLGQRLTGLSYISGTLAHQLRREDHPAAALAGLLRDSARQALEEAHALARGLNPVALHQGGLAHALGELAVSTERLWGMRCAFRARLGKTTLRPEAAYELFRIAQEAVHNAVKHAGASQITIRLFKRAGALALAVEDDGAGPPVPAEEPSGMGMLTMRHRARALGGSLMVYARKPSGLGVRCALPLRLCAEVPSTEATP